MEFIYICVCTDILLTHMMEIYYTLLPITFFANHFKVYIWVLECHLSFDCTYMSTVWVLCEYYDPNLQWKNDICSTPFHPVKPFFLHYFNKCSFGFPSISPTFQTQFSSTLSGNSRKCYWKKGRKLYFSIAFVGFSDLEEWNAICSFSSLQGGSGEKTGLPELWEINCAKLMFYNGKKYIATLYKNIQWWHLVIFF